MNKANEAALTKAIAQVLASPEGWRAMAEPAAMARELIATCGALVPNSLTSVELTIVWEELEQGAPNADKTRRTLERIAKGGP